ncbi:hypothetical protein MAR_031177, partial [Mya arenaria]
MILDTVANHKTTYNCAAIWNYFETGHGKGPCDGLGGTSSFGNVSFVFVGDEAIREILGLIRPVKRTMKLHAVVGNRMSSVLVTETSCYCAHCLSGERCSTWREEPIRKRNPVAVETALIDNHTEPEQHVATVAVEHGQYPNFRENECLK